MDENLNEIQNDYKKSNKRKAISIICISLAVMTIISIPVFAWFYMKKSLAAYAPVSSPEALFIGAGHIGVENKMFTDEYEDIKYLYLEGIDATLTGENRYYDYIFSVYGRAIPYYKLQIAFTTNNPFTYEIYEAIEEETQPESGEFVVHTTHSDTPTTYYYAKGTKLTLVEKTPVDTYDGYTYVQMHAYPEYWQTSTAEIGEGRGAFVNYYILRVCLNGKYLNDRETDIVCIAAKSTIAS